MDLHPIQRQYIRNNSQERTAVWGRRAGKTRISAAEKINRALTIPGIKMFTISYTQDQAMLTFRAVEQMLFQAGLESELAGTNPIKHSPFGEMRWANGSEYHARGAQHGGKFLRGWSAHILDLDEAGMIPDATINEAILPMGIDYDGQINKLGTPWGQNHLWRSFRDGGGEEGCVVQPGCYSVRCSSYDNPFISRRYIERVLVKNMSKLQIDTEILALFSDDIGKVFPWRDIQSAYDVKAKHDAEPNHEHTYVMGWDLAKHLDHTVGIVIDITDPTDLKIVHKERFNKMPWDYVIERIKYIANKYQVTLAAIDATGLGDPIVDRLASDIPIEAFKFTGDSKPALVNNLKVILEEGRIHFDYWPELVEELRYFSYELSARSHHVLMGTQSESDDCVIALGLAVWAFTNCFSTSKISAIG